MRDSGINETKHFSEFGNQVAADSNLDTALLAISNLTSSVTTPDEFYSSVYQYIEQLFDVSCFFVALKLPQSQLWYYPFFTKADDTVFPSINDSALAVNKTLCDYVLNSNEALLCDRQKFKDLFQNSGTDISREPWSQWLGVPILTNGSDEGVIVIQRYDESDMLDIENSVNAPFQMTKKTFGQTELAFMSFVGQHSQFMLNRLKHHQEIETISLQSHQLNDAHKKLWQAIKARQKSELLQKKLFNISNLAISALSEEGFFYHLHRTVNELIPATNCFIAIIDKDDQNMINFPFYTSLKAKFSPKPRKKQDGLVEYILSIQRPALLNQNELRQLVAEGKIYRQTQQLNCVDELTQWAGIPLKINNKIIGVLVVYNDSELKKLYPKDLELLTFVSQHISSAIDRKETAQSLQQHYELLDIKIKQRTQSLLEANDALKTEISRRKKVEQQLAFDAAHDGLTGVPNRKLFLDRLNESLAHQTRYNSMFALLFIDLDGFKMINDNLGHHIGDHFLIETVRRLEQCIRSNDVIGRFGGDEFVLLLNNINSQRDAEDVALRFLDVLSQPVILNCQQIKTSASIGIVIADSSNAFNSKTLLSQADTAMYQAKIKGKGRYAVYVPEFSSLKHSMDDKNAQLENELKKAIDENDIKMRFLPIYHLRDNHLYAIEARLYWEHPKLGKIKQLQLTAIAEQAHLRKKLDCYALNLLGKQYKALMDSYFPQQIHLALNGDHLTNDEYLDEFTASLENCGIPPATLCLFFKEKNLVQDTSHYFHGFELLKNTGVNLGIEGYGSSFSALTTLSLLPISAIKIDNAFAGHIHLPQSYKLVKACIQVTIALELKCFVCGVDDKQKQSEFTKLGADFGQGPVLGKIFTLAPTVKSDVSQNT